MTAGNTARGARGLDLALCLALFLAFGALGALSPGTHNDDDLTRFVNTRHALHSLEQVLSLWNRPAFVLCYLLPAQLGYWAIEWTTALVAALTCFIAIRIAARGGEPHPTVAALFVALQPFFLALCFSALTEPLAALFLALSMHQILRGRMGRAGLATALLPLARLELAVLLPLLAVWMYRRGARWSLALLPLGLLAWNLAGLVHTGDPLFLVHQVLTGEARTYDALPYYHYLQGYVFVVGPALFAFSIAALADLASRRIARSETVVFSTAVLLVMLATHTWLATRSSAGQSAGFLRHFVAIAPALAMLGLRGLNQWLAPKPSWPTLAGIGFAAFAAILFLSRELEQGRLLSPHRDWMVGAIAGLLLLAAALQHAFPANRTKLLLPAAILLVAFGTLRHDPRIQLSPEQQTVQRAAQWLLGGRYADRPVLTNHLWFLQFTRRDVFDRPRNSPLTMANLESAPAGAVALWEGHYSHRLVGDVSPEKLDRLIAYRLLQRFLEPKTHFFAVLLEKLTDEERRSRIDGEHYELPGQGVIWDHLGVADGWNWRTRDDGPGLLSGRHPNGGVAQLNFIRYAALEDPAQYLVLAESNFRANPKLKVESAGIQGDWHWLRGQEGSERVVVATRVERTRLETVQLVMYAPLASEQWMESQLATMLPSLRLRPTTP